MASASACSRGANAEQSRDQAQPPPAAEQGPKPTPLQPRCAEAEKRAKELGRPCALTIWCEVETARAAGPEQFEDLLCEWIRKGELDTAIDYMGRSTYDMGRAAPVNNDPAGAGQALLYALSDWKFKAARVLLEELHADAGATNRCGATTLMRAAGLGPAALIRALLAAGADPRAADNISCSTALHCLAKCSDDAETARLLLEAGASPNAGDDRGWTPLVVAAHRGHTAVMKALLAAGADPLAAGRDGVTARSAPSEFIAVHWILRAAVLRHRLGKACRLLRKFPVQPRPPSPSCS